MDAAGQTLVDSTGRQSAYVQTRDPKDGSLVAQSSTIESVSRPYVGGVFGNGIWVSNATGNAGYIERFSLRTLNFTSFRGARPHRGVNMPASILGTNGITARVIDATLWVTQAGGGPQRNYCGDPLTGVSRAALRLPAQAEVLTIDARRIYFLPIDSVRNEELEWAPESPRC